MGYENGGTLKCTSGCRFDTSECVGVCGDDFVCFSNPCFSGETVVNVLGKGSTKMEDLQVHDNVLAGTKTGASIYQEVYSFGHLDHSSKFEYLQIFHDNTKTAGSNNEELIEISPAHLVCLVDKHAPVRADTVQVVDQLLLLNTLHHGTEPTTVTKIKTVVRKGAYLPLTTDGTIIVNDITASTYVSIHHNATQVIDFLVSTLQISEQRLFHYWITPYRMVCRGVSSK